MRAVTTALFLVAVALGFAPASFVRRSRNLEVGEINPSVRERR